ncbi:hypothetical protein T265_04729 [Opisthorchis viverrini]|uniref:Uncharacterized protein n=1 Tax=Opisthorchis viverrini TaxID=6198 RepID=A0A074ZMQ8_OPIVI|nr:hypothetical protein T265_04729 [Opisthorchis viverrini]KER28416.1 hypothetical protein T265_04729 [Opisthorchis viverrini]
MDVCMPVFVCVKENGIPHKTVVEIKSNCDEHMGGKIGHDQKQLGVETGQKDEKKYAHRSQKRKFARGRWTTGDISKQILRASLDCTPVGHARNITH